MKKLLILLVVVLSFVSCADRVSPGYVGIRTYQRGDKAGQSEVLGVGKHSFVWATSTVVFPTFRQNYVWTQDPTEGSKRDESIKFAIEGMEIGVDIGIEFSVIPDSVAVVYAEYRKTLDELTAGPLRNYIRDAITFATKDYNSVEEFITGNLLTVIVSDAAKQVKDHFRTKGIDISKVYIIGKPHYPPKIVAEIENKVMKVQQAAAKENEVREAEAQAKINEAKATGEARAKEISAETNARIVKLNADAEAYANEKISRSLTPLLLEDKKINKWNGVESLYNADGSGNIISIK